MTNKKYLIKSINFGKKGELSREIIEVLEKRAGKIGLSKEIKRAIVFYFMDDKQFNEIKIKKLLHERKELSLQIPEISKELQYNEKKLNKLGYKL